MTTDKKEEKTILTYDDRRKILNQKKSITVVNKQDEVKVDGKVTQKAEVISTVNQSMNVDYTENGIRMAHKNLVANKKAMEGQLKKLSDMPITKLTDDQKKLKKDMAAIIKFEEVDKAKKNYDAIEEELGKVKKELSELEEAIGTRLKF